ncbi:Tetratricopeptide TPR_2 repeat protein [Parvibaculum lavamentivorans DS-1]|uniref:Tetratricopeptide TPR_2 repeat protein n=1 Tax=Parvibaculum lavamentivorans (strain DS-1 / DSM 13023 / NCIMB 13966) TaxID=402881 RepID=A7HW79_PARL1|nr:tetratricopeptide repeat protein [Parvibaculum lavamentivorans]ABS64162.1 Tetratricopeptide TPR_2 repeat protein [Parvibaculum lavamentivorans DS-1]
MSTMSNRRLAAGKSVTGDLQKKYEQGLRLLDQGRANDALTRFRKVLAADPRHVNALNALCRSLIAVGRPDEAVHALDAAAASAPEDKQHLLALAGICFAYKHVRAEELYRRVLTIDPDAFVALGNLASIIVEKAGYQEAVDLISHALEIRPDTAECYNTLGRALAGAAMYDEAEASYRRAIAINPELPTVYANYGALLDVVGRQQEALQLLQIALNMNPDCDGTRWNLARALLATGHIEAGWDMYGFGFACRERSPYRPFPGLIWEGEDLSDKTFMVWREQGLGDDLYFSTCYHDLVREAGHLIIETDRRLVSLYQRTWPEATVRAETGTSTGLGNYGEVDFDVTAPAGIVASRRRRSLQSFPANPRPLVADPARRQAARDWLATLGPGPRIGFCWRSSVRNPIRASFATRLEHWLDFLKLDTVQVVNLQYGEADEEIIEAEEKYGIRIHRMPGLDTMNDLEGTAALTAELDFFVAQWNASSEMAGALCIPGVVYLAAGNPVLLGTGGIPWHPCLKPFQIRPGFDPLALTRAMTDEALTRLRAAGKL